MKRKKLTEALQAALRSAEDSKQPTPALDARAASTPPWFRGAATTAISSADIDAEADHKVWKRTTGPDDSEKVQEEEQVELWKDATETRCESADDENPPKEAVLVPLGRLEPQQQALVQAEIMRVALGLRKYTQTLLEADADRK